MVSFSESKDDFYIEMYSQEKKLLIEEQILYYELTPIEKGSKK